MSDLQALAQPFAEQELRHFEGRGGKTMTFIEDETVMDRLDAAFGVSITDKCVDWPTTERLLRHAHRRLRSCGGRKVP